jgi:signal transduction histidine kinase
MPGTGDVRRKVILRDIVDREEKRFNIDAIRIYDQKGDLFVGASSAGKNTFLLERDLSRGPSRVSHADLHLQKPCAGPIQRSAIGFTLILAVLFVSGAGSIYAFSVMERKYAKRVKEMEREMEIKERLVSLGKLASGMAHEIRNPLNAISLSVQRLKREFVPSDEKKGNTSPSSISSGRNSHGSTG